jgi:DNA-binding transcriptional ArsR family regulator
VPDDLVLREPAQFKALGHPLRHRLLVALRQRPATLAQLATALTAPKGTVGYHVKVLLDAGVVRLAYARTVRGGTEQYYEPTSPRLRIAPDAPVGGDFLIRAALAEMRPPDPDTPDRTLLRHLRLTPTQATTLATRLESLAADLPDHSDHPDHPHHPDHPGDAGEPYGLLLSVYRSDLPTLPPDDPP